MEWESSHHIISGGKFQYCVFNIFGSANYKEAKCSKSRKGILRIIANLCVQTPYWPFCSNIKVYSQSSRKVFKYSKVCRTRDRREGEMRRGEGRGGRGRWGEGGVRVYHWITKNPSDSSMKHKVSISSVAVWIQQRRSYILQKPIRLLDYNREVRLARVLANEREAKRTMTLLESTVVIF